MLMAIVSWYYRPLRHWTTGRLRPFQLIVQIRSGSVSTRSVRVSSGGGLTASAVPMQSMLRSENAHVRSGLRRRLRDPQLLPLTPFLLLRPSARVLSRRAANDGVLSSRCNRSFDKACVGSVSRNCQVDAFAHETTKSRMIVNAAVCASPTHLSPNIVAPR